MSTFTSVRLNTLTPETSEYAAIRASAVSTADPMAKPLPVAAVVLPSESSASVRSRTSGIKARLLRDAARVVGHGAVGVRGEGDAER